MGKNIKEKPNILLREMEKNGRRDTDKARNETEGEGIW